VLQQESHSSKNFFIPSINFNSEELQAYRFSLKKVTGSKSFQSVLIYFYKKCPVCCLTYITAGGLKSDRNGFTKMRVTALIIAKSE
jgi:hypothetical protein